MPARAKSGPSATTAQATTAAAANAAKATHSRVRAGPSSPRFQVSSGPTAMDATMGAIKGRKTALKNGGPTETLPPPTASRNSG
jgi:hypothetical protein